MIFLLGFKQDLKVSLRFCNDNCQKLHFLFEEGGEKTGI